MSPYLFPSFCIIGHMGLRFNMISPFAGGRSILWHPAQALQQSAGLPLELQSKSYICLALWFLKILFSSQAVSCDEAFLDVSESEVGDPQLLGSIIRKEIFDTTGCTASAGIAGNMLMARLATKTAKPDGQCYIPPEKV